MEALMPHIIRMSERRFPQPVHRFAPATLLVSLLTLLAGVILYGALK